MNEDKPGIEEIAFMELKSEIVKLMFAFTGKYAGPESSLYPKAAYILVDVLTTCLSEAQYQVVNYQPFTIKQRDHICYQIGEWYCEWERKMWVDGKPNQHWLGYAKEQLKTMICDE